eukprot:5854414-Alexandrium_andersonii.AAC.1
MAAVARSNGASDGDGKSTAKAWGKWSSQVGEVGLGATAAAAFVNGGSGTSNSASDGGNLANHLCYECPFHTTPELKYGVLNVSSPAPTRCCSWRP